MELWNGQPAKWHLSFVFQQGEEDRAGAFLTVRPAAKKENRDGLTVGLGKREQLDGDRARQAGAKMVRAAADLGVEAAVLDVAEIVEALGGKGLYAVAEGAELARFMPRSWKADADKRPAPVQLYLTGGTESAKPVLDEVQILADAVFFTRDLVSEPPNFLTPETMADRMRDEGAKRGIQVEVFEEARLRELGMEAFLAVAHGAVHRPRMVVMRYDGAPESGERIGLVGKGITFDTGGYNLKPSASMMTMQGDMGGAAAVCGCMLALAERKVPVNAVAVVPAAENRISGDSYLAGDIVRSMSGKTIEIGNTDAEGRLLLVDAMTYAVRSEKITKLVDIATLTGAVVTMFGNITAGLMSNDDAFCAEVLAAAGKSGERYWRLPADASYKKMIESPIADLRNTSFDGCSTVTAGLFLQEFCENLPWVHLDIAGTSWVKKPVWEYQSEGATGAGVTTLYHLCKGMAGR